MYFLMYVQTVHFDQYRLAIRNNAKNLNKSADLIEKNARKNIILPRYDRVCPEREREWERLHLTRCCNSRDIILGEFLPDSGQSLTTENAIATKPQLPDKCMTTRRKMQFLIHVELMLYGLAQKGVGFALSRFRIWQTVKSRSNTIAKKYANAEINPEGLKI